MNLRNLLNFEITKASPRWKAREFEGAELVRARLAEERWARWAMANFRLVFIAMLIPMVIDVVAFSLDLTGVIPVTQIDWQLAGSLVVVLGMWGLLLFGPELSAAIIDRFLHLKLRTKFVEPPMFRGWMLYVAGWFFSGLSIIIFTATAIAERSFAKALQWTSIEFYLLATGWAGILVARGLYLHLGDTICCRNCSYPVPPDTIESPGTCTECGRDLARKRGMMIGQRRFRPVSFYAGLGIVAAATVLRFI